MQFVFRLNLRSCPLAHAAANAPLAYLHAPGAGRGDSPQQASLFLLGRLLQLESVGKPEEEEEEDGAPTHFLCVRAFAPVGLEVPSGK